MAEGGHSRRDVDAEPPPGYKCAMPAEGVRVRLLGRFEIVISNILLNTLEDLAPALAGKVADGGRLVLCGLLAAQTDAAERAYVAQGLRPLGRKEHEGWARDEWDIAVQCESSIALYRLVRDRLNGKWIVEGRVIVNIEVDTICGNASF